MMLNTAESAGEREAGGDPAHLSERRRCQLAMSKLWTDELEKGTTARSNLTTATPPKVQWSSGLTIRVGDMVRVAPCVGGGKVQGSSPPRCCRQGGNGEEKGGSAPRLRLKLRRRKMIKLKY